MNQVTLSINGIDRTFFIGLATWNEYVLMRNDRAYERGELPKVIKDQDSAEETLKTELSFVDVLKHMDNSNKYFLEANRDFMYCALKADCQRNRKPVDFSVYEVGEWLNEMPQEDYQAVMKAVQQSKYLGKTWDQWQEVVASTLVK